MFYMKYYLGHNLSIYSGCQGLKPWDVLCSYKFDCDRREATGSCIFIFSNPSSNWTKCPFPVHQSSMCGSFEKSWA